MRREKNTPDFLFTTLHTDKNRILNYNTQYTDTYLKCS